MLVQPVHLSIFSRMLGKCVTPGPRDPGCWTVERGRVVVDAARAPELSALQGAIRLEGKNLPGRILLFRGADGRYHAVANRCAHGGRRLDPVPGAELVQCCSLGRSTYDYGGHVVSGPAPNPVHAYPVETEPGRIVVVLDAGD